MNDLIEVMGDDAAGSTRNRERRRFILLRGVLGWGVPTALLSSALMTWVDGWQGWERFLPRLAISLVAFPIAGIGFGADMWSRDGNRRGARPRPSDKALLGWGVLAVAVIVAVVLLQSAATKPLTHESVVARNCSEARGVRLPTALLRRCGHIEVMLDGYDQTWQVWVEIVGESSDVRAHPPILIAPGGPGLPSTDYLPDMVAMRELFEGRDVLFIDPFGTGGSDGRLTCSEYDADTGRTCESTVVAHGVPLGLYSSAGTAAAFKAVGDQLGVDQWDVLANSYGGDSAFRLLMLDASRFRSAVFAAPSSPWVADPLHDSMAERDAIERAFFACENEPACGTIETNTVSRWQSVLIALDADPLRFDSDGHELRLHPVTATQTAYKLIENGQVRQLPALLVALEQHDIARWQQLNGSEPARHVPVPRDSAADGSDIEEFNPAVHNSLLHAAFICHDGVAESEPPPVDEALVPYHDPVWVHQHHQGECQEMGIEAGKVPDRSKIPAVPVLVLAGELDPRIALSDAQDLAQSLPAGQLVAFKWFNHWILQQRCAQELTIAFFEEPGHIDHECTQAHTYATALGP